MAIGNFDGVHLGHARIVERVKSVARQVQGAAVLFTFEPHPATLLRPDRAPPPLTWLDRKAFLLEKLGVDALVVYPTDMELLHLAPEQFFQRIILDSLNAKAMVEGPNFYFGRDRKGDIELLRRLCREHEVALHVVEPIEVDRKVLSSSLIREQVSNGDVAAAAKMLGYAYRIHGEVIEGARRGTQLGFPTANLAMVDTMLPAPGVYAGVAYARSGKWPAAVNIGPNPTFAENSLKVEAHLIDCRRDFYGQRLEIEFWERIREVRRFQDAGVLVRQLQQDIAMTREIAARFPTGIE